MDDPSPDLKWPVTEEPGRQERRDGLTIASGSVGAITLRFQPYWSTLLVGVSSPTSSSGFTERENQRSYVGMSSRDRRHYAGKSFSSFQLVAGDLYGKEDANQKRQEYCSVANSLQRKAELSGGQVVQTQCGIRRRTQCGRNNGVVRAGFHILSVP